MDIRCQGAEGEFVITSRENLCLWAMLLSSLAPMAGMAVTFPGAAGEIGFLTVIAVFISWIAVSAFAHYRLWKAGSRLLRPDEGDALFDILGAEAGLLGLKSKLLPRVYVTPWDTRVTARVLGGFTPKLLVSGGLVVVAARHKRTAATILRHELVHILAGDTTMFFYLVVVLAGICAIPYSRARIPLGIAAGIIEMLLLYHLLRRREYLADACSLNWASTLSEYKSALLGIANERERGLQPEQEKIASFHPDNSARIVAIEHDSPVLRTSIPLVAFFILLLVAGVGNVGNLSDGSFGDAISLLVAAAFPIVGIVSEVSKGFGRKHPLPFPQFVEAPSDELQKSKLLVRQRPARLLLANVIGVASDDIEWSRVLLFSVGLYASHGFVAVRGPFTLAAWLLVTESLWAACVVVAVRYMATIWGAALFASAVNVVAHLLIRIPFHGFNFAELAMFPFWFLGALLLIGAIQFVKPLWLGLFVAALGENLLLDSIYSVFSGGWTALNWSNAAKGVIRACLFTGVMSTGLAMIARRKTQLGTP
jgi:Zn-dependent protease with chaperone function